MLLKFLSNFIINKFPFDITKSKEAWRSQFTVRILKLKCDFFSVLAVILAVAGNATALRLNNPEETIQPTIGQAVADSVNEALDTAMDAVMEEESETGFELFDVGIWGKVHDVMVFLCLDFSNFLLKLQSYSIPSDDFSKGLINLLKYQKAF